MNVKNTSNTHNNRAPALSSNTHALRPRKQTHTMENEQPPSSSTPRGRRGTQRYRRGAHNVTLDASARLALTQHFAMKSRTQAPPASDPISLNISSYYTAPLGARRNRKLFHSQHTTATTFPPTRSTFTTYPLGRTSNTLSSSNLPHPHSTP